MAADLWYPGAVYRGPTPNEGDGDARPGEPADRDVESRGLVWHIAEGTYEGTIAWQRNDVSDVSSEFVVGRTGLVAQTMPVNDTAWTQRAGNGHWDAAEFEGHSTEPLTPEQIEAAAQLYAWGHVVRGWPLQLATSPSGRGLGHHSMGAESGVDWGHSECPGPIIKAQKPIALARSIQIVNGTTSQPRDEREDTTDMPRIVQVPSGQYLIGERSVTPIHDPAASAALQRVWGAAVLIDASQLEIVRQFIPAAAPPAAPVTVDAATLAAALADPAFLAAVATAVLNEDHRRSES